MLWYFVIYFAFCAVSVNSDLFGPQYPPTKGEIWPKPLQQISENIYYTFTPDHFNVSVIGETCNILENAVERYSFIVRNVHRIVSRLARRRQRSAEGQETNYKGSVRLLQVDLTSPCEQVPYFGMIESYNLTVGPTSVLTSSSVWGIFRGLESWSQLFYLSPDEMEIRINKTDIHDAPKYPHRGLLIDTSRHYISLSKIIKTLDAMSMNKLNVLHWHIVDDQSFPYQSEKFPYLSRLGAYHSSMIYTKDDIRMIIAYATERGIRVLPEIDVPGHTRSWGQAYPNLLTACYAGNKITGLGPLNPIKNTTYDFLKELFVEIQELFLEKYFHVGGDEVDMECWVSNVDIIAYMQEHDIKSAKQLHAIFMERTIPLLGQKSTPIVWQEVFDEGVPLSNDSLIQVWKGNEEHEMVQILRSGYKLLFSSAWYLDQLRSGGDWTSFYSADPRQMLARYDGLNLDNIVGGEACMWGEVVDDVNIMSRVWPRASAVAERLWSSEPVEYTRVFGNIRDVKIPREVYCRLEEHVCRMRRRGIAAQPPSGPGFCLGAP